MSNDAALSNTYVMAVDIETYDPHLKTMGPGSIRHDGHIIGVGFYCPELDISCFLEPGDARVAEYLSSHHTKVFHNGVYDLDWLINGAGFTVNGKIEDTMTRETLLDAYDYSYALDHCCEKRGLAGKNKGQTIDAWWANRGGKGKAVEHLDEIPFAVVAKYCIQDCIATLDLFYAQQPLIITQDLQYANDIEASLYPWLMETRKNGMIVDWPARRELSDLLNDKLAEKKAAFQKDYGDINIGSGKQLEVLWKQLGLEVQYSEKGLPSFTHDILQDTDHPAARLILEMRGLQKLIDTFIDGQFVDLSYHGRLWPILYPAKRSEGGTVTGRFSSQSPNGQNIPAREDKYGKEVRSLFIPEEGCLLGAFDYKQIEYRLFSHFAIACKAPGWEDLEQAFKDNPDTDYHQMTIDLMDWGSMGKEGRHLAKNFNFTCCSPDSYFATKRGYIKAVDLREDDVLVLDSGKWRAFIGSKPQYRITLSNGQQFKVTHDHPFKLFGQEVGASQLREGTAFEVVPSRFWGDIQSDVIEYSYHKTSRKIHFTVDESIAYLLGVWTGDGSLHMQYNTGEPSSISFCTPPENTQFLKDVIGHKTTTSRVTDKWEVWMCTSKPLSSWIMKICGKTDTKHVPDIIYRSPRSVMIAFMQGFLDSDGTVHNNKPQLLNTNEELMRGLARCCAMLGWEARWSEEDTPTDKKLYRLHIRKTPLTYKELQGKVRKWEYVMTSGNKKPVTVTKIEDIGIQDTFCIELPPPHWYEAECHINHNSIYGLGVNSFATKFKYNLMKAHPNCPEENIKDLAKSLMDEYFTKVPFAKPTCLKIQETASSRGYVRTIGGRRQRITPDGKLYKIINYLVQGSAGDMFKKAMVDSWNAGVWKVLIPHIMVHDEMVFSIPQTREGYEACLKLIDCMQNAYNLKVPIGVDTEIGPDWGHCTEENWEQFASRWK